MGFMSDMWDGVKDFLAPVVSAVSSVLRNSELMQKLMPMLMVAIPPPWDVVACVVIEVLSVTLGNPENPEQLGWQMNEADKKPEDFDSFAEYRAYLDEEFPFHRESFEALSDYQKAACRYAGMAGTIHELSEATDFRFKPASLPLLVGCASKLGWSNDALRVFTQHTVQTLGSGALDMLVGYASGTLDPEVAERVGKAVSAGVREAKVGDSAADVTRAMADSTSGNL